jgi:CheY-like chemotaxis protein
MSLGRILVVDDEPEVTSTIADVLVELGYVVEIAGDGAEAIGLVSQFRPEVVLLDVLMPGVSGAEVLAWLRQELLTHSIRSTTWGHEAWPQIKPILRRTLEMRRQIARDGRSAPLRSDPSSKRDG